ncbi:MAG: phosphopentomutase, partial [Pyrinomonadaceae bacterium]
MGLKFGRVCLLVLDSVGIGEMPDAAAWGDAGAHTLGHILESRLVNLSNLRAMGLGNITHLKGLTAVDDATGSFGKCTLKSNGKDTSTGHWEMAGIILKTGFPTFPGGFPARIIDEFVEIANVPGVLGNYPA